MKLSIITINYNNREGLKKTIESVVSQTFRDYEYIIIDGGSTDGSVEIIKQHADQITYWISEPDKGIYDAMNKGIRQSKGEYCQFLNSGDRLYSNTVLSAVFQEDYAEDLVTGNVIEQYKHKTVLRKGRAYICEQKGKSLTLFDMVSGTITHPTTFIRKKLFDQYGLYNENYKIVSDWVFFLETIGLNGVKVKYIDINIAYFDMYGISIIDSDLRENERMEVLKNLLPPTIFDDYIFFSYLDWVFHNLLQYKSTYLAARFVNKLATLYDIIDTKIRAFCIAHGMKLKHKERTF
ncbi:glycosyl transferase [Bacteroidia bacterium]|nr:glycosyl transferase [Bacteroidia bacterium]GHV70732.1 glycosyl transferase [Bacteroidia bacterium]